ncbi:helix-turn-helix domain-containing protein [Candidatus Dependentiae bacterium]|nr:helix-turn-helix domain-containing protein [Candidatus Dependentiae bacterium]
MISTKLRIKELLRERRWTTKVLAELTGLSESYLTHIKNGTRRWNEDALAKMAEAFEIHPTELFEDLNINIYQRPNIEFPKSAELEELNKKFNIKAKLVPVLNEIPSQPNEYNNRLLQMASGNNEFFLPVVNCNDNSAFAYCVQDSSFMPTFFKGDYLIVSPETWSKSGNIVAIEYGEHEEQIRDVVQVNYIDDFIILESVNHKKAPIALIKGKDNFRIIGKVIYKYQKMA